MDPAEVVRFVILLEALQKVDDTPRSRRVLAAAGREWTCDEREERAVDQRVPVDEKEAGGGRKSD
jgi:hypothetical protein